MLCPDRSLQGPARFLDDIEQTLGRRTGSLPGGSASCGAQGRATPLDVGKCHKGLYLGPESGAVLFVQVSNVDPGLGQGGQRVGADAAFDYADVHRAASVEFGQRFQGDDLVGQLADGVGPKGVAGAGVSGTALHLEVKGELAPPGGDHLASFPATLQDECAAGLTAEGVPKGPRVGRADLLVAVEENDDGAVCPGSRCLQGP